MATQSSPVPDSGANEYLAVDPRLGPETLYQHSRRHTHGESSRHHRDRDRQMPERGQSSRQSLQHADHGHNHSHSQDNGEPRRQRGESNTNRLNDFASHILESHSQDGDHHDEDHHDHHSNQLEHEQDHEHEHSHEHAHGQMLSFTGEGGVLESSSHHGFHAEVEHAVASQLNMGMGMGLEMGLEEEGEFEPHYEDQEHDHEHDGEGGGSPAHAPTPGQGPAVRAPPIRGGAAGRARGRGRGLKRPRPAGAEADPEQGKKEAHKEVERKRRNVISEGIDLLVTQMGLGEELAKAGKGQQLRRAVEYVAELGERIGGMEKEVEDLRKEKQDLEANLALTSQRYTEEHDRCTRYETMWRDAQDREAKGQFEIAQLLDELAQARAKR